MNRIDGEVTPGLKTTLDDLRGTIGIVDRVLKTPMRPSWAKTLPPSRNCATPYKRSPAPRDAAHTDRLSGASSRFGDLGQERDETLMHRLTAIAALCIFAGLAAGCASSPVTRFYTLSAGPRLRRRHRTLVGSGLGSRPQIVSPQAPTRFGWKNSIAGVAAAKWDRARSR